MTDKSFVLFARCYSNRVPHFSIYSAFAKEVLYLKDEVGIDCFTADKQWEYITAIRDARNMVVHNGGKYIKILINTINLKSTT